MARVSFTRHLRRFFPDLHDTSVEAHDVAELVRVLEARHAGLAHYLVDDAGHLRKHVNVFVDGTLIADRTRLGDPLGPDSEVHVMQALSGG
jgi:sulfur-carrier protein